MTEYINNLMKRVRKAWSDKDQWVGLYDDAYSLALPNRNTMSQQSPGAEKNVTVYDSTLQQSTTKLASILQSTIVPPFSKWAIPQPGPFVTQDTETIKRELKTLNDVIFAALGASNFDTVVSEFFLDLCIGTGIMIVTEGPDDNPFQFTAVPLAEVALEAGGGVFRKYVKTVREIQDIWKDGKSVPELDNLLIEDGSKQITIHEITYKDHKSGKYLYQVLLEKIGNGSSPYMYVNRKYNTNPFIVSRWLKCAGENYGRGPVINALPDAKTLNMAKKLELQNASLAVSGVYLARNNGVLNGGQIRIQPGGIIPVQSTGGSGMGADIVPLQVGGNLNYSQIVQESLRQSIKDAMFDRSIPDQGAVRSATEWIVRQQELHEAIGAPFGRLYQEMIVPLYKRMLNILQNKGIVPKSIQIDGGNINISITGQLAQAQNLKEVETITNWAQTAISISGPEVFQATAKVEEINKTLADLMGIDPNLIRSDEEQKQLLQLAQQAAIQGGSNGQQPV